jgi:hypothetical protein
VRVDHEPKQPGVILGSAAIEDPEYDVGGQLFSGNPGDKVEFFAEPDEEPVGRAIVVVPTKYRLDVLLSSSVSAMRFPLMS